MALAGRLRYFARHELIQSFSPVYFAANMGTGSISKLFNTIPYVQMRAMKIISLLVFLLNLFFYVVFTIWGIVRYIKHPKDFKNLMRDPKLSLFWGCFPMAGATLLSVAVEVVHQYFSFGGEQFLYSLWILWWVDVAVSCLCCWGMVHYMITSQTHTVENMTPAWLLPVVTLIVASSTGGVLANVLQEHCHSCAMITVTTDVFIVTVGFTLSFIIFTIYFQRLYVHNLPPALSVFLPLGPTGQAGYSVILIGQNLETLLHTLHPLPRFLSWPNAASALSTFCICIAFLLWTFATLFLVFALLGIVSTVRKNSIPFSPVFWGLVFPNGVYATLTISLGELFDSSFFRVYGAAYATGTFLLWLSIIGGSLFYIHGVILDSSHRRN